MAKTNIFSELETLEITLPSGRPAEIRELTGAEEKIFTNRRYIADGSMLNRIMLGALVSLDGKPLPENQGEANSLVLDMKIGDRSFLLLKIRQLTYGDKMIFNYKCPKCENTAGYELNIQKMLDDGELKIIPYRDDTPITIKLRSGEAEIDYLTGRDELWLSQLKEENRDLVSLALAQCKSINGKKPTLADMEKLPARDLAAIREAAGELEGGFDGVVRLDCLNCGAEFPVQLTSIPDFFIPLGKMANIGA